jgi:hypothetical protein
MTGIPLSASTGLHRQERFFLAAFLATYILLLTGAGPASASIVATLVDPAGDPATEGLSGYGLPVEWSAYIDPSTTNWIGFHNTTTPTTHPSLPGRDYIGGAPFVHWIGLVNDYLDLTITNTTTGASLKRRMDYNDALGNDSGTQSVIFGTAATAPDVHRLQNPFGSRTWVTFDEAGAFNSFFQTAATYDFRMTYGNTGGGSYSQDHDNIYFLIDAAPQVASVPEPPTWAIWGIGCLGLAYIARRRKRLHG